MPLPVETEEMGVDVDDGEGGRRGRAHGRTGLLYSTAGYPPRMTAPLRCDHCAAATKPGEGYCSACGAVLSWSTPGGAVPPAARAFLLVHLPGGIVRKEPLSKPVVRVGRGRDCEIVVDHPRVSRLHALLELREGTYYLSDAKSSGGTFLNDRPVHAPVRLHSGDPCRLGRNAEDSVTLVYHEEA